MKYLLRIALPPLHQFAPDATLAFALIRQRDRTLLREGKLPVAELASAMPSSDVEVVLSPGDAIIANISIPIVEARHMDAAVLASVEPMTLSDPSALCIAHGARNADGHLTVAWASRQGIAHMWAILHGAGLALHAIYPQELLSPGDTTPLCLPVDGRWLAPRPSLSMARIDLRPSARLDQWKKAAMWASFAALLWTAGLHSYAARLESEAARLRSHMSNTVAQAFPDIPVILDPVQQAEAQRDALLAQRGTQRADGFAPLVLATAKTLDFAASRVRSLHFEDGELTLTLSDDNSASSLAGRESPAQRQGKGASPSADTLQQAASVHALVVQQDKATPGVWHIRRQTSPSRGEAPS